ncbi:MAG: hypothetical protein GWO07_02805 [Candidatus Dadabacteria bacterium]|nr:hypothetical protein [Candidatus Dadabacteria bacterium]NIS07697.1 hypothetical protein [Candidatus Dadabacteria bacterium]NIV42276.1 hypothetical protein [Candidatus Dadabacteria bacterium]NIX14783.1 hypothetical protein [Candidatus Dadabacteria bacterium]NIY21324.1 hypothetical protein [Candidatus Dadabacteria bacterium]
MITIIVSSFGEISNFIKHGKLLKQHCANNQDIKSIEFGSQNVYIIQSGVGIKNARIAASYAINNLKSEKVYITGVAGALDSDLKIGDVVVGDRVFSLQKDRSIKLEIINDTESCRFKTGGILTHNRFVNTSLDKHELHLKSQAVVVDMETWGAAEVCEKLNIPLYAVRSVSDLLTDNLPDLGYIYNTSGRLNKTKSAIYFSKSPYLLYKYIEFRFYKLKKSTDTLSIFLLEHFGIKINENT